MRFDIELFPPPLHGLLEETTRMGWMGMLRQPVISPHPHLYAYLVTVTERNRASVSFLLA